MKPVRFYVAAMVGVTGCIGAPGWSASNSVSSPDFVVEYRDVDRARVEGFIRYASSGKASIVSYLGRPYAKPIRIDISDDHRYPRYDSSTSAIVLPASRIRGDAKGPPGLKGRGTAIILVLTEIIAPSRNREWGGFLKSGLGVYLQERFGDDDDPSFPNMGSDLHEKTARFAAEFGRLIPLEEAERERTATTRFRRARTLSYLEQGSFVRFLIESRGLENFLKFYDGAPVGKVYGLDFKDVEAEWRRMILVKQSPAIR